MLNGNGSLYLGRISNEMEIFLSLKFALSGNLASNEYWTVKMYRDIYLSVHIHIVF